MSDSLDNPVLPGLPGSDDQRIGNGFGAGRPAGFNWAANGAHSAIDPDYECPELDADGGQFDTYIAASDPGPAPNHDVATYWGNNPADYGVRVAGYSGPSRADLQIAANAGAAPETGALVFVPSAFDVSGNLIPGTGDWVPRVPLARAPARGSWSRKVSASLPNEPYHYALRAELERLNTRDVFPFPDALPGPAVSSDDGIDSADVAAYWDMRADGMSEKDAWGTVNGWRLEAAVSDYWRNRPRPAPSVPLAAARPLPGWPAADGPVRPAPASLAGAGGTGRPYRRGDMLRARLRKLVWSFAAAGSIWPG